MKNPSSKLTRMRLELEEYDFTVQYLRGKDNHIADALSRITIGDLKELTRENNGILTVTTRSMGKKANSSSSTQRHNIENIDKPSIYVPLNNNDVRKRPKLKFTPQRCYIKRGKTVLTYIQIDDLFINGNFDLGQFFPRLEKVADKHKINKVQMAPTEKIFEFVSINEFKNMGNKELKNIKVALLNEVTKLENAKNITKVMKRYHEDPIEGGHCGISRTLNKIKRHYYWKNMTKDVTKYVRSCQKCQRAKTTKHLRGPMITTPTPTRAFDSVLIDTIGPLPRSANENEYAVTIICDLTKYLVTIPVKNKSAKTIAKAIFENFILTFGTMKTFITDMGTEYKNTLIKELCELLGIENITSTAHHHQTLGTIERSHRTFNEYVRSYISVDKDDWDDWLKYFTYCFNTTPSSVHDYCPYELVFGKIPNTFSQFQESDTITPLYNIDNYAKEFKFRLEIAYKRARRLLDSNKLQQKINYDRNTLDINFKIGDLVLLKNETGHKLEPKYIGPYKIQNLDLMNNATIINRKTNKKQIVHKDGLKLINNY